MHKILQTGECQLEIDNEQLFLDNVESHTRQINTHTGISNPNVDNMHAMHDPFE